MIEQTPEYYDKRWTDTIKQLPKGGDYRNDLRLRGWSIIADHIGKAKSVFDFATGVSHLPMLLASKSCLVHGCDFSKVAVNYASEWGCFHQGSEIIEQYDYITACQFLEHIENPVEWLNETFKHTKKIIISIPNNFHVQGDHYLMQWNNWGSFNELFKDFNYVRLDTPELYSGIPKAWNHPTFEFTLREVK